MLVDFNIMTLLTLKLNLFAIKWILNEAVIISVRN